MTRWFLLLAALAAACGGEPTLGTVQPPPPVATVQVTPPGATVESGLTAQLSATARDANGNALTGPTFTWSSSSEAVATVSQQGLVTGLGVGTATITATADGKAGTSAITVTPGPLATIIVTPNNPSPAVGDRLQLQATAADAHGNAVPGVIVAWSSGDKRRATVSASGEATALATGQVAITATAQGKSGSTTLQVRAGQLEIHQINVGWGSAVLIRGPDGTTVLLEGGNTGDGASRVVPYLQSLGIEPASGLDFTIAGHQHCDHVGGLDEVVIAGYDVRLKNFFNGSATRSSCTDQWGAAALTTTAGAVAAPAVGTAIALGSGAFVNIVAVNGDIIGGAHVTVSDENDRSIAALLKYRGFDLLWASDMGGGDSDNACTGRSTSQANVESAVIKAISPTTGSGMITSGGIDVLYVNHHGSESSTNAEYMNLAQPALAVISTGGGQSANFMLPRKPVIENVLLAGGACIAVPPALVLQNEEGDPTGVETSFAGMSVGNVVIRTDGLANFRVTADGAVTQGPVEILLAGLPRDIAIDDRGGPVIPRSATVSAGLPVRPILTYQKKLIR
jgi:beta-lactamase superfamily II metal-dependent hydrolase